MTPQFEIVVLGFIHDRKTSFCAVEPLDRYFREQASQNMKRRVTACYVALDLANSKVAGYYILEQANQCPSGMPE